MRAKENSLFFAFVMATKSSEHNQKNSKRVQRFAECFGVELVVRNNSTLRDVSLFKGGRATNFFNKVPKNF